MSVIESLLVVATEENNFLIEKQRIKFLSS